MIIKFRRETAVITLRNYEGNVYTAMQSPAINTFDLTRHWKFNMSTFSGLPNSTLDLNSPSSSPATSEHLLEILAPVIFIFPNQTGDTYNGNEPLSASENLPNERITILKCSKLLFCPSKNTIQQHFGRC